MNFYPLNLTGTSIQQANYQVKIGWGKTKLSVVFINYWGEDGTIMKQTLHIYTRVSTISQKDEGTSLDEQKRLGIAKAKELGIGGEVLCYIW